MTRGASNDKRRSDPASTPEFTPKDGSGDTGTVDVAAFEDTLRDVDLEFNRTAAKGVRPIQKGEPSTKTREGRYGR